MRPGITIHLGGGKEEIINTTLEEFWGIYATINREGKKNRGTKSRKFGLKHTVPIIFFLIATRLSGK